MCMCMCVLAGERDDPQGEQIDGIMHVLNIITMQNLDGILGGIQSLMGLSNGNGIWDWTHKETPHTHTHTHTHMNTLFMRR